MGVSRLSKAVYELRQKLNLSQTELGAKLGVSAMAISRWETGRNDPPADAMAKMAKLSGDPKTFWFFLGQAGLTKRDFTGRL
ncbi:MAG TPA: helix-turn-helix transcriptional regulator [Terriglobales bacterium]|nr:helix-turn-helix transcriptional regulator [Terriglobales bacterium]